jgi:hypothetical protein
LCIPKRQLLTFLSLFCDSPKDKHLPLHLIRFETIDNRYTFHGIINYGLICILLSFGIPKKLHGEPMAALKK